MGERAVGPVGEDLLGLGVAAVLFLGRQVNGESVKTAWYRQAVNSSPWPRAALRLRSLTRRTMSRAVMACPLFEVKAVYCTSATWAPETQASQLVIPDGPGIADRRPGVSPMAAIAARTLGSMRDGDREARAGAAAAREAGEPKRRRVHPDYQRAGAPGSPGGADSFGDHRRRPAGEGLAFPPRSRVAAITGAASGVLIVSASAFRPRPAGLTHR